MTEEEIETVAQELAKVGGLSWYPGRTRGALLRAVSERYRDRARVAIAALERLQASKEGRAEPQSSLPENAVPMRPAAQETERLGVGSIVVYRAPGERRAVPCQIEKMENGRAYLVPCPRSDVGWVPLEELSPQTETEPNTPDGMHRDQH